jgi:hypothetical protein
MYVTNMYIIGLVIYRFEGEKAIPCAAFSRQGNIWDLPNAPANLTICKLFCFVYYLFIFLFF